MEENSRISLGCNDPAPSIPLPQGGGVERLAAVDLRLSGLRVVPCSTLYDALKEALGPDVDQAPASGRAAAGGGRRQKGSEDEEGSRRWVGEGLDVEEGWDEWRLDSQE